MILNVERDALIQELIIELHNLGRTEGDEDARDLADCISYMHGLWKAERKKCRKAEGNLI